MSFKSVMLIILALLFFVAGGYFFYTSTRSGMDHRNEDPHSMEAAPSGAATPAPTSALAE